MAAMSRHPPGECTGGGLPGHAHASRSVSRARHLAGLVVALGILQACGRVGDHERRGDEAYGQGRFSEALGEYRIALANDLEPRLLAKVGAASLRTGNLEVASDAYLRLAAEDPSRAEEADQVHGVPEPGRRRGGSLLCRAGTPGRGRGKTGGGGAVVRGCHPGGFGYTGGTAGS